MWKHIDVSYEFNKELIFLFFSTPEVAENNTSNKKYACNQFLHQLSNVK